MYKYEILHYTRKNSKISLDTLSKDIGVSKSYLSSIETGNRRLSYDLAVKIAKYFKKTPDQLFLQDHLEFTSRSD